MFYVWLHSWSLPFHCKSLAKPGLQWLHLTQIPRLAGHIWLGTKASARSTLITTTEVPLSNTLNPRLLHFSAATDQAVVVLGECVNVIKVFLREMWWSDPSPWISTTWWIIECIYTWLFYSILVYFQTKTLTKSIHPQIKQIENSNI